MTQPDPHASPRDYLASLEQFGIKLGLENIRAICHALGGPQHSWPSVLIAGTNGKGSVAAFTSEALRAAGHRVGRYTSPHLIRLEERFHIDGRPVSSEALDEAIDRVRRAVVHLQRTGGLEVHPTYFEVTTAAAFWLFASERVNAAVLEVGLGGRFDATNVVTPRVSCITTIALDHEQHLGSSLTDIAREKAGIIKADVPLVTGTLPDEAHVVIAETCRDRHAPLVQASDGVTVDVSVESGVPVVRLTTPERRYDPVRLGLRGEHQVHNAVVAVRVLETLHARGIAVAAAAIRHGLEAAEWPGRLDLRALKDGRRVLLDGAHNPAGAEALALYLRREWPGGLPLVFGAMRDKNLTGMLAPLAPVARPLVLTHVAGSRSASTRELSAAAHKVGINSAVLSPELSDALERAWSIGRTIAVAGSLYLAGAVLERIEGL